MAALEQGWPTRDTRAACEHFKPSCCAWRLGSPKGSPSGLIPFWGWGLGCVIGIHSLLAPLSCGVVIWWSSAIVGPGMGGSGKSITAVLSSLRPPEVQDFFYFYYYFIYLPPGELADILGVKFIFKKRRIFCRNCVRIVTSAKKKKKCTGLLCILSLPLFLPPPSEKEQEFS